MFRQNTVVLRTANGLPLEEGHAGKWHLVIDDRSFDVLWRLTDDSLIETNVQCGLLTTKLDVPRDRIYGTYLTLKELAEHAPRAFPKKFVKFFKYPRRYDAVVEAARRDDDSYETKMCQIALMGILKYLIPSVCETRVNALSLDFEFTADLRAVLPRDLFFFVSPRDFVKKITKNNKNNKKAWDDYFLWV